MANQFSNMSDRDLMAIVNQGKKGAPTGAPQSPVSSLSDSDLMGVVSGSTAPLGKQSGLGKQVVDSFYEAGVETMRGVHLAVGEFYDGLADVNVPGAKLMRDISNNNAKSLPETKMSPSAKAVYNFTGAAPIMLGEFESGKAVLQFAKVPQMLASKFGNIPAVGQMTESMVLAAQGAVQGYKDKGWKGAVEEGIIGAEAGLSIPIVIKAAKGAIGAAMPIVKEWGLKSGAWVIKQLTGDEALAKDFIANPTKYNVNLFKGVSSLKALENENKMRLDEIRAKNNLDIENLHIKQSAERETFNSKLDQSRYQLMAANDMAKQSLAESSRVSLDNMVQKSSQAFKDQKAAIESALHGNFTHAHQKLELISQAAGEQVGVAINNLIEKDPAAVVKTWSYLPKFAEILEKNQFQIVNNQIVPNVRSTIDKSTVMKLQTILDDIFDHTTEEGIPLGFAQKLKQGMQRMAYDGEANIEKNILKQLSGALNPARMVDDIVGRNIGPELKALAEANAKMTDLVPRYNEALKLYSKVDANGQIVPDFSMAINAVRRNDRAMLGRMYKADQALLEGDKFLPKVKRAAEDIRRAESIQASVVRNTRRKIQQEKARLTAEIKKKTFEMNQAMREKKFNNSMKLRDQINHLKGERTAKLEALEMEYADAENFLKRQDTLRSFTPPAEAGPGVKTLNTFAKYGLMGGALSKSPTIAGPAAAAFAATSPVVAANAINAGRGVVQGAKKLTQGAIDKARGEVLRKLLTISSVPNNN